MSDKKSATLRLFWRHLAAAIISSALILGIVYLGAMHLLQSQTAAVVEAEIEGLVDDFTLGGERGLSAAIVRRTSDLENADSVYLYTASDGVPIAGNLSRWPAAPLTGKWVRIDLLRTDIDKKVAVAGRAFALRGGGRLFVGRDLREQREFRELWELALFTLALFSLLSGTIGGFAVTRTVLNRVKSIQAVNEAVERGDLAARADVDGKADEFDRLAISQNRMLDKNQALLGELRMVTDSLAHDLRTPLAHLRNSLEELATKEPSDIDPDVLSNALSESQYIHKVFTDLLDISRADAGLAKEQFEKTDLSKIVSDAVEFYQPLAEHQGIDFNLKVEPGVRIEGHAQFLSRAIANLLDNAIKFTPPEGNVTTTLEAKEGEAWLTVTDTGPGISNENWAHALTRFGRLDQERRGPGAGLGLSLVASVAELHEAQLLKAPSEDGLSVQLVFRT